jgi:hypothetical protein
MPDSEDKLQERAVKLQERAAKLQEREAKLQEREAKLQEREAFLSAMGWPFASNMVRPSGFGGFFVAAYITPVGPSAPPSSNGASLEDEQFGEIAKRSQQIPPQSTAPTGSSKANQAPVAQSYKIPVESKL